MIAFSSRPLSRHGPRPCRRASLSLAGADRAQAEAQLLIEAATGKVLHAENATYPWYPASVTKLMTAYTTLRAVKEGRISLNTLLTVSRNAAAQPPTKMGFNAGTTRHRRQRAQDADGEVRERHGGRDCRRRRRLDRGLRRPDERQRAAARHDAVATSSTRTGCRPKIRSPRRATWRSWRARSSASFPNTTATGTSRRSVTATA